MIIADNVSKSYKDRLVIKKFNFTFKRGLYLIVGKSGCGKSTLLNILSCHDKKYSGRVKVSSNILYIKDRDNLVNELTVKEHYKIFEQANHIKIKDYFNTRYLDNKKVKKLSLGEKQLIMLNMVLNSKETIIILDEPMSALSFKNLQKASKLLELEAQNKLIIMSCHNKEGFENYTEIDLSKKNKLGKTNPDDVSYDDKKRKFKFYYYLIYLKKNLFKKIIFMFSLVFVTFNYFYLNEYFNNSFDEYLNNFKEKEGVVISKSDLLENIDEIKFYELIKELSLYIQDYNINYYNSSLYEKDVVVDNYYIDNGFIFSCVKYIERDLKDREIILGINYKKFCLNNKFNYCDEEYVKTVLVNKKIEGFNFYIGDIFNSEDNVILSNKRFFKLYEDNEYVEYYFDIYKEDLNDLFEKVNDSDYLSNFSFIRIGENDTSYRYKVELKKYFNEDIDYEKYIVCLKKGYDCLNYLNHFNSILAIDNFNDIGKVDFKIIDNTMGINEIVVSTGLSNILNKKEGDDLKLKFEYNGDLKEIDFIIKKVIDEENYYIYQNSCWSYDVFKKLVGFSQEDLRVDNIIVFEEIKDGDYEIYNPYNEMLVDFKLTLNNLKKFAFWVNVVVTLISIIILFVIEIYQNKFKKEYYRFLRMLNISCKKVK